ncbi:MAG: LLM class flavin-dependent oxidoreductase [Gammaproteobacteria bacterium]|nr:LLM class flavin-dependent oxidoreductase [Gammaproteobacteria bacterium]
MTRFGYLIPTREAVMGSAPAAAPLLELATRAERAGYDSVWVGDSLLARPRHDPLTLLAAISGRTENITLGTAVLLPAYRNPVLLAQQLATLDQVSAGRLIVGVGIAADRPNIRAEFEAAGVPFERRVGRLLEGLRLMRALWRGDAVDWDGRWTLRDAVLGPLPHRPGGPPVWGAGSHPNSLARAGKSMDGWLPIWPDDGPGWRRLFNEVCDHARAAGRARPTGAHYLTCFVDDSPETALQRVDDFLARYYDVPGPAMRKAQACFGGNAEQTADWIEGFVDAGVEHIVLRFAGDHVRHLGTLAELRARRGW